MIAISIFHQKVNIKPPLQPVIFLALQVGDQIIEINQTSTKGMTHGEAIELIKEGGSLVRLLVQRGARLPQVNIRCVEVDGHY